MSPDALAPPALVCASPVTADATMSPLKSDRVVTCDVAPAFACAPLVAVTLVVTELALTMEPSVGYEKAPSKATASAGASSSRVPTLGCPGMITLIAHARAIRIVGTERPLVRVLRIGGDFLRDGPHLVRESLVMGRARQQRLDPAVGAVVVGHVVVEEQLPEQEAAADVGERAEGENAVRRLDESRDLGVLVDDLLDDRADRLVDQRDPELVVFGHRANYGCFPRARQAI